MSRHVVSQLFGTVLMEFSDVIQSATCLLQMLFGVVDVYWDSMLLVPLRSVAPLASHRSDSN